HEPEPKSYSHLRGNDVGPGRSSGLAARVTNVDSGAASPRASGCERQLGGDRTECCGHCLLALRRSIVEALCSHELDIGNAEKSQYAAQVVLLEVQRRCRRSCAIDAAARRNDDDLFALGQPFWSFFRVAKRLALDGNAVDPGLELARNREVVH